MKSDQCGMVSEATLPGRWEPSAMGDGKTEAVHFLSLNLDLDNAICPVKRTKAFYCPSFFCLLVYQPLSLTVCLSWA